MSRGDVSDRVDSKVHETVYDELTRLAVIREANRCLFCYDAPCTKACPTHIDVPSFIKKITTDNLSGSARVIMDANPLGASCARVCPTEDLCEGACVLGPDDSPIRIGDLQRYATDWAIENGMADFTAGPATGHRVAIVGGGPAGLSAARELARAGHDVTIFEAKDKLGGLNTYGIVPFRLPMDVALWEAAQVEKLGVTIRTNCAVGRDVSVDSIASEFDAIVLTYGLGSVPQLNIPGENLSGVWDAIDFIEKVKTGTGVGDIGSRVAIVGAGNTAIDAATCSKRLGAEQVTLFYRRTEHEMTAYPFEYEFAKQEGVEFRWKCAPLRIVGESNRVKAIEFIRTELQDDGKAELIPGSEFVVEVDTVIRAIGQSKHLNLIEQFGLSHKSGVVDVQDGFRTSQPSIFAAGDNTFVRGSVREAMVVEAAEQGKIVARSVHQFLQVK